MEDREARRKHGRRALLGALVAVPLTGVYIWTQESGRNGPWMLVGAVGAWHVFLAALGVWSVLRRARGGALRPLPRPNRERSASLLMITFASLCLLIPFRIDGVWMASDLGVNDVLPPWKAFGLGILAYGPVWAAGQVGWRLRGGSEQYARRWFRAMHGLIARDPASRRRIAAAMVLNPVAEEALTRGVLVFLLGDLMGGPAPAVGLGLVLCLLHHLYQGLRALPFHAAFFGITVALLYSPLGLVGAIGFHFAGDMLPFLRVGPAFQALRAARAARASAGDASAMRPGPGVG